MKILYLDCGMGAAGDMLSAALLELLSEAEAEEFLNEVNALGIPGVRVERQKSVKCGVAGTHLAVTVDGREELDHDGHRHRHGSMPDIEHLVREHLALPERVKDDVLSVYGLIAGAESRVHGVPVTDIHFHEVGTLDAVADITMFCLLMHHIAPDEVVVSPVRVGFGQVRCAHGVLPVPAPATAELLKGVPVYAGDIRGEMCTPTGAALLRHFAARFGEMPLMRVSAVGCGCGTKNFKLANCLRAMLGETESGGDEIIEPACKLANCLRAMLGEAESGGDEIIELACNVDDMTAEEIGFAMERLFDAGALDVYTAAVGMKKNRPGTLIRVICAPERRGALCRELFRHTTTLGVRECAMRRHVLERGIVTLDTPAGPVRRKDSHGFGVTRRKYEFDDLAAIARERGISLREAAALVEESER